MKFSDIVANWQDWILENNKSCDYIKEEVASKQKIVKWLEYDYKVIKKQCKTFFKSDICEFVRTLLIAENFLLKKHDCHVEQWLELRCKKIELTLGNKAGEYAKKNDRLHKFRVASKLEEMPMIDVARIFMLNHIVSILDLLEEEIVSIDAINEKIGDAINYCILIDAIKIEKEETETAI